MAVTTEHEATIARIAADLRALGVREGGVLLVHSSLSALGWVAGGAETVIQGLLAALGSDGTLLLPGLSYRDVDASHPDFDVRSTPACVGTIPEYFRTRAGTLRSVHPTHSVCGVGAQAAALLADHPLDTTPVGAHSPFRRVRDAGGQVLFLGCGMRPDTSMHGVEELVEPPRFLGGTVVYRVVLADGSAIAFPCRRHHFAVWRQRYDRLEPLLRTSSVTGIDRMNRIEPSSSCPSLSIAEAELRVGPVLAGTAHLVEARALWGVGLATMQRDPYYFVERIQQD